jgi:5-methylthioadenosine/S-adenosylhomocysteine deaminase
MTTTLLRNVVHHGEVVDVWIANGRFGRIGADLPESADITIDAAGRKAIMAPFYNGHTHAAMTLLRGFAEDLDLHTWLTQHIWPAEARLTEEQIYAGSRLAILEMIKSGTVFFNDMYWEQPATARAAAEMGVRAEIGLLYLDGPDGKENPRSAHSNAALLEMAPDLPERITIAHAPHSPYAVSTATLMAVAERASADGRRIHTHAAETQREVDECLQKHGMTPISYLDSLGLVGPGSVLAHCVHLSESDRILIAERQATIAHMPVSNLKLRSGFFDHSAAARCGCRIVLGTDGAASNNSLSMFGEMKTAALLAKSVNGDEDTTTTGDILSAATVDSAHTFGIDAGVIAEGHLADAVLVNLDHPSLVGQYNLSANLIYAADSGVVDTVICDGQVLMADGKVPGEEDIIAAAQDACAQVRAQRTNAS